jgi:hypothetical protein
MKTSPNDFRQYCTGSSVSSFYNLGKDAILTIPCPKLRAVWPPLTVQSIIDSRLTNTLVETCILHRERCRKAMYISTDGRTVVTSRTYRGQSQILQIFTLIYLCDHVYYIFLLYVWYYTPCTFLRRNQSVLTLVPTPHKYNSDSSRQRNGRIRRRCHTQLVLSNASLRLTNF